MIIDYYPNHSKAVDSLAFAIASAATVLAALLAGNALIRAWALVVVCAQVTAVPLLARQWWSSLVTSKPQLIELLSHDDEDADYEFCHYGRNRWQPLLESLYLSAVVLVAVYVSRFGLAARWLARWR